MVYAAEIGRQFSCDACAGSPAVWERMGRCFGPIVHDDPTHSGTGLKITNADGDDLGTYSIFWDTCPLAYLRDEFYRDETDVMGHVLEAQYSDVKRHHPDIPGKLFELVIHMEGLTREKHDEEMAAREKKV